jgi:hypothetical protein
VSINLGCITQQKKEILVVRATTMSNITDIQKVLKMGFGFILDLHYSAELTCSESNIYYGVYSSVYQQKKK